MFISPLNRFIDEESGQGISEYGAILAFVAFLISITFVVGANYRDAVLQAFTNIVGNINALSN